MIKLIPLTLVLLIIGYFASLSFNTRNHRIKPTTEHKLTPCPDKPNCVSSKVQDKTHTISSFAIQQGNAEQSWNKLVTAIQQSGGEILINNGQYCHAVFTSMVFRFKDDLEMTLADHEIDIRSASRAGKYDLGQNRKRVEAIRVLYVQ